MFFITRYVRLEITSSTCKYTHLVLELEYAMMGMETWILHSASSHTHRGCTPHVHTVPTEGAIAGFLHARYPFRPHATSARWQDGTHGHAALCTSHYIPCLPLGSIRTRCKYHCPNQHCCVSSNALVHLATSHQDHTPS